MPTNPSLKQRLHSGAPFHIGSASIDMSEAELERHLAANPCDMVFVDLQHSPYTEPQLVAFCAAATRAGSPAFVRLRHPRLVCQISSLLDFGAGGVLIPLTEEPATVAEALEAFYYPPIGGRSVGPRFAHEYEAFRDPRAYADWWNESGVLALQIETVRGVANASSLALPGVDLLLFGGTDLSFSLAANPDSQWRTFEECQQHVVAETRGRGVRVGVGELPFGKF
jgi:2-keto-3-deoxy-L-rhamnonate aldolase RhmA